MDSSDAEPATKQELLEWLDAQRRHVSEQVKAMPAGARRQAQVPSGWTPRGLIRHLALDVERVWFRAVMAGEHIDLPEGYEGWTALDEQTDEDLLEQYASECKRATAAISGMSLNAEPAWWFEDGGSPPHSSLREVILHVIVETATHAGHLDICRELVDGGQRLVLDEPTT
ncbi:DinB family protein [Janibacter alittae]|uniref:DinB family protein n=1 Tax=Janibacter alittae TaxID=3115209 RepID=A0ABZ2MIT4_9MICO